MKRLIFALLALIALSGCQHVGVRYSAHLPVTPVHHRHVHNDVVIVHEHHDYHAGHHHANYSPSRVVVAPRPVLQHNRITITGENRQHHGEVREHSRHKQHPRHGDHRREDPPGHREPPGLRRGEALPQIIQRHEGRTRSTTPSWARGRDSGREQHRDTHPAQERRAQPARNERGLLARAQAQLQQRQTAGTREHTPQAEARHEEHRSYERGSGHEGREHDRQARREDYADRGRGRH